MKETNLKVLEAYTRDVGRGVARIDYDTMDSFNLSTGSMIEIAGKRKTVAKCLPLYPSDEGKNIIRYDGLMRQNAQTPLGSIVKIKKVETPIALKIVVSPLEKNSPAIDGRYLADALESVPVALGDEIMVPYFGGRIKFQIVNTEPQGHVLINQKTVFKITKTETSETLILYEEIMKKRRELLKTQLINSIKSKDYELIVKSLESFKQLDEESVSITKILENKNLKDVLRAEDKTSLKESLEEAITQWLEKKHKGEN